MTQQKGAKAARITVVALTRGSTGHDVQFQLTQLSEDRPPNHDLLRKMGYAEVDEITYDGQTVTIMGQAVGELLVYQMYLPARKSDGSQGHVQVTFQISPASDRCLEERASPDFVDGTLRNQPISCRIGEGDGLRIRRLRQQGSSGVQVLACRILTVCGEVAERLKAAVC